MSTPIEALAHSHVDEKYPAKSWSRMQRQFGIDDFLAGAKAASGRAEARIKELEIWLLRTFNALDVATDILDKPENAKTKHELELGDWASRECLILMQSEIIKALSGAGKGEG